MSKNLLFFEPVYKTPVWGGKRMRDVFGYNIPSDNTGEYWAISAHQNGDCVCNTEEYKGKHLSELWKEEPELFGNYPSDKFPLLLKIIDAKEDLSISVHPNDEYAMTHENGSLGKAECWYILDCDEGASLDVGHNATTREELCSMIDNKQFSDLIRNTPIKKGDFIPINPGTIHTIKKGVMLLETQQNSDITYRIYDYDRLQNGKKRELHLEQAKAVVTVPSEKNIASSTSDDEGVFELVACKYYKVYKMNVNDRIVIEEDDPFRLVSCIEGCGTVNGINITKGSHFIVPNGVEKLTFEGKMTLISSVPV